MKSNKTDGFFSLVNTKFGDKYTCYHFTIVPQYRELSVGALDSTKIECYLLYVDIRRDLDIPIEYPKPKRNVDFDSPDLFVNTVGDFHRVYKTLKAAKRGAVTRLKEMLNNYVYIRSYF